MSIDQPARRRYRCDACGRVDVWGPDWSFFGSIILEETCPDLLPHVCSEACREIADAKLASGEWKLPVLSRDKYHPVLRRPQIGYGADQAKGSD